MPCIGMIAETIDFFLKYDPAFHAIIFCGLERSNERRTIIVLAITSGAEIRNANVRSRRKCNAVYQTEHREENV